MPHLVQRFRQKIVVPLRFLRFVHTPGLPPHLRSALSIRVAPFGSGHVFEQQRLYLARGATASHGGRQMRVVSGWPCHYCNLSCKVAAFYQPNLKLDRHAPLEGYPVSAILSSLTAFFAAGARPQTPLAKAIVLVLVIKLIGITGMMIFMFPDSSRPTVDATAVMRVIGPPTSRPQPTMDIDNVRH